MPVFEQQGDRDRMAFYAAEGYTLVKREFRFSKKGIVYLSNRWVLEPRWGNWAAF